MSEAPGILLLAAPGVADRLAVPLSGDRVTERADPFAALAELAQRPYQTVLVAVPQPDLPGLLRAIRQLQPNCRLFGLCTPAGEAELRHGRMDHKRVMEDYFIIPPTVGEWRRILAEDPPKEPPAMPLTARQVSRLIESVGSTRQLCDTLAAMVAEVCRCDTSWSIEGERGGVQHLCRLDGHPAQILWAAKPLMLDEQQSEWLSALRAQLPSLTEAAARTDTLNRMAMTDHLTGVYNRRYFLCEAAKRLEIADQKLLPATLLVYDIDDFKLYNDTYGHTIGDEILREIALLMRQTTRRHDLVARIGGDEFAVLFCDFGPARKPGSKPPTTAYDLASRFREAVNSHTFKALGPNATGTLTISGGLATFPWSGHTIEELMVKADEALLAVKSEGKNNIRLIGGTAAGRAVDPPMT